MLTKFKKHLDQENLAQNTISAYLYSVRDFEIRYKELNKKNLLLYKNYLIEQFKPKTVNLRIQAMNKYLLFMRKSKLRLKSVKVQGRSYLDYVISNTDYKLFRECLLKEKDKKWYFIVRFFVNTGVRVSELKQFKVEHVKVGYLDIYSKGGKLRRIFIPKHLREEFLLWLQEENRDSGYLFLNRYGNPLTTRGIAGQLKKYALKYGLNVKVVYPHSFRHRFAKNFLDKTGDLALLADLMGHESIETTRIYLRRTTVEQQGFIDKTITW